MPENAMPDTDAILSFPWDPPEPDEFVKAGMRWHFSEDTGSAFWLEQAKAFDFDPLVDIKTFDDLKLFPNVVSALRTVKLEDLVPKGYGSSGRLLDVYESGGTTGAAKRVPFMRDWRDRTLEFEKRDLTSRGLPQGLNWLSMMPGRPHYIGGFTDYEAVNMGGVKFSIDMDPRWVKKLAAEGRHDQMSAYAEHLVDQAEHLLLTQDIGILLITPPLLERLCRRGKLVEAVREKVSAILWGGTHMDADTRRLYRTEVFPGITMVGGYGNTMYIGIAKERIGLGPDEPCVFDGHPLHTTFRVIDDQTGEPVPCGERGRVVATHLSKSLFLPNNMERDTAIRVPAPAGQVGDSVAHPEPLTAFEDEQVNVGVY